MELQYWHFAVVVALVALVVWGLRASWQTTLVGLAGALLIISSLLFYTLVLDEEYLESDLNSRLDSVALIGIPALLGVGLGVFAFTRTRSRRG